MTIGRRDLIKFATGGACGIALTPVPWQLLNDTGNWSQNWSWIPTVPRGEVTVRASTCTVCPAACAVKAECVGGRAVTLAGARCPVGLQGHVLAYHPKRLRTIDRGAIARIAGRINKGERAAILDLGPERAVSALYRQAVEALGNAVYLRGPDRREATLNAAAAMLGREPGSLGLDLEHLRTLVSFGAPVLERWAAPGRAMERWRSGDLRVIQVEPRQSRTALAAYKWVPTFDVSLPAGLEVEPPAAFVGSGDDLLAEQAIAAMNFANGSTAIAPRSPLPWKTPAAGEIAAVPDCSIGVLFVDSSRAFDPLPWPMIRRKLTEGALVVSFAYREDSFTGRAGVVLPVSAPYERLEDAGTPPCSAVASYAVAPVLIDAPAVRETAADHLNAVLAAAGKPPVGTVEAEIKRRASAIHAAKKGTIDGTPVADVASPDDLWKKLASGVRWIGEAVSGQTKWGGLQSARDFSPAKPPGRPFTLLVHDNPDQTSPLSTKLYQESGLFPASKLARMNHETAAKIGLTSGMTIVIETAFGAARRELLVDPAVMPGVVEASADIADITTDGSPGNWRVVPADVRRA